MFYLLKNEQIRAAETFDGAARLVAKGWELITRDTYRAWWRYYDDLRLYELKAAATVRPLQERSIGG